MLNIFQKNILVHIGISGVHGAKFSSLSIFCFLFELYKIKVTYKNYWQTKRIFFVMISAAHLPVIQVQK